MHLQRDHREQPDRASQSHGIHLRDGSGNEVCSYNTISGNTCAELRPSSPTDVRQQLYGIYLEDANCDSNVILGNITQNNKTGSIFSTGTADNRFVITQGKGTAIASAATVSIPSDGDIFHVTGTTNITNGITVNDWDNGRTVKLIFDDILTVTDTGTSVLQGNFTSAANDVLCLCCDGTNWVEVSRN